MLRCDSRNLNLSPLCDLGSHTKPQAWAKEVKEVYDKDRSALYVRICHMVFFTHGRTLCCSPPDYVARVESPIRQHYPVPRAKEQEIIESIREDSEYNAYDKDIAVVNIFFGKPTTIG